MIEQQFVYGLCNADVAVSQHLANSCTERAKLIYIINCNKLNIIKMTSLPHRTI